MRLRTVLLASILAPLAVAAQQGAEPVLLEVRIGSVASETIVARRSGDDVLLPRAALLALAGLTAPLPPDSVDRFIPLDSARALLRERIDVDWTSLVLTISDSRRLPVSRRAAREGRRAALRDANSSIATGVRVPVAPSAIVVDYNVVSAPGTARALDGALRVGAGALGGSLGATWSPHMPLAASWLHPFDSRFVKQLRVGEAHAVPIAGPLHDAVTLGNTPPVRDLAFGAQELIGTAPPGADVEIVSAGELVGWAIADPLGRYRIRVPITYGANAVTIIARDSAGEDVRREQRDILVAADMLPARSVEYTLASGRCTSARCRHASVAELRLALSDRLTLGGAGAVMRDSTGVVMRSELGIGSRIRDATTLAMRAMSDGSATLNVTAGASPSATSSAVLRWRSARSVDGAGGSQLSGSGALDWLPLATSRVGVHASGAFGNPAGLWRARTSVMLAGAGFRAEPFARASRDRGAHGTVFSPGIAAAIVAVGHAPVALHVRIERNQRALATSVFARGVALDASATWRSRSRVPTLRLSLARHTPAGRYATTVLRDGDARPVMLHTFDGSLIADFMNARVRGMSHSGAGALRGHVFVDVNHNGVFDPGEPTVADAVLSIGGMRVESDARGEYTVWGLAPFTPLTLRIESLSAPYVQHAHAYRVELLPDVVATLDIAVERE